jgi:rhodanese-related sulfurtransferase
MQIITRQELKAKIDQGDDFKLVMVMAAWHYDHMRLPGSIRFNSVPEALAQLDQNDDIVVYCTGGVCAASMQAYHILKAHGYNMVRRYEGGLMDWIEAGYALEGA